jgi:hypothetical protein
MWNAGGGRLPASDRENVLAKLDWIVEHSGCNR